MALRYLTFTLGSLLLLTFSPNAQPCPIAGGIIAKACGRERLSLNANWRFQRTETNPDGLIYDRRPDFPEVVNSTSLLLKPWILPSANEFIRDLTKRHDRPAGSPGNNVPFVQDSFDDSTWETVNLPHDWAIKGPFYVGNGSVVGGDMGRLPSFGVGWYRRKLTITPNDEGKSIFLEIDGAMSYAIVWLNGYLVGGWPYGYNSFRLDLTPYLKFSDDNQLAIRLDNPNNSSRWYPGGGIYRNVWLTKLDPTHIAHYGTFITSRDISSQSATVDLAVQIENHAEQSRQIELITEVHILDSATGELGERIVEFPRQSVLVTAGEKLGMNQTVTIPNPQLWGPRPVQQPNLYAAVSRLFVGSKQIDIYQTSFGIRSLVFDPNNGVLVNGQLVKIQGVNNHHDLGSLGASFNVRAAERQLEILQELGGNAVRTAHNPPAPELLDLADRKGILILDEIFDAWQLGKVDNDFHLIFRDWYEADLRSFLRRDRNHPSVIAWSYGNEIMEQRTRLESATESTIALAQALDAIVRQEDPTRLATSAMDQARPNTTYPRTQDILSLNYQGHGVMDTPAYSNRHWPPTPPMYGAFHEAFPDKVVWGSETAAAVSSRGTYIFPVVDVNSAPANDTSGGNSTSLQVSAYELYSAVFGSSPEKVFTEEDRNPFLAGGFVWAGFDYLGEPMPYQSSRSSYFGILDLAGFKKDRAYLYQSRWRPDLQMAHILPHWNWPDRIGQVTPVHAFSAADEAELFFNGHSQGRRRKEQYSYRFRWDEIVYQPGELQLITYKNGKAWANDTVRTTGAPAQLRLTADRSNLSADGVDISFLTIEVLDARGDWVRQADSNIVFSVAGPGDIVATDNGNPADFVPFPSSNRRAYSGLALCIVRGRAGESGFVTVTASSEGLQSGQATLILQ